jgi:flavin reductase (DIM6/NTAB) family NADH-FMN oxidoreductase RutF
LELVKVTDTLIETQIDPRGLRDAFARFPSGVAALAANVDGTPQVLVASSFTVGVSQDPPLVLFAVQRSSTTWPLLASAPTIGVSVLGECHAEVAAQLASKDKHRRFDKVGIDHTPEGAILLTGAPVTLECATEHVYPAGDHDIVVLRVLDMDAHADEDALVWYRSGFTTLAKGVA